MKIKTIMAAATALALALLGGMTPALAEQEVGLKGSLPDHDRELARQGLLRNSVHEPDLPGVARWRRSALSLPSRRNISLAWSRPSSQRSKRRIEGGASPCARQSAAISRQNRVLVGLRRVA